MFLERLAKLPTVAAYWRADIGGPSLQGLVWNNQKGHEHDHRDSGAERFSAFLCAIIVFVVFFTRNYPSGLAGSSLQFDKKRGRAQARPL